MPPKLPLPRGWKRRVRSSVLHILPSAIITRWNNGPSRRTWTSTALQRRIAGEAISS